MSRPETCEHCDQEMIYLPGPGWECHNRRCPSNKPEAPIVPSRSYPDSAEIDNAARNLSENAPDQSALIPSRSHPVEGLREALAALCHAQWSGWMEYLFSKCERETSGRLIIPQWAEERWKRQLGTPYADLSKEEKDSDRQEADRILAIIQGRVEEESPQAAPIKQPSTNDQATAESKGAAPMEDALDLEAAKATVFKADREIARLCDQIWKTGKGWHWEIPANPERDSDLILSAATSIAVKAIAELERLRAKGAVPEVPAPAIDRIAGGLDLNGARRFVAERGWVPRVYFESLVAEVLALRQAPSPVAPTAPALDLIKKAVGETLLAAVSGREPKYRYEGQYIRWGLVEADLVARLQAIAEAPRESQPAEAEGVDRISGGLDLNGARRFVAEKNWVPRVYFESLVAEVLALREKSAGESHPVPPPSGAVDLEQLRSALYRAALRGWKRGRYNQEPEADIIASSILAEPRWASLWAVATGRVGAEAQNERNFHSDGILGMERWLPSGAQEAIARFLAESQRAFRYVGRWEDWSDSIRSEFCDRADKIISIIEKLAGGPVPPGEEA